MSHRTDSGATRNRYVQCFATLLVTIATSCGTATDPLATPSLHVNVYFDKSVFYEDEPIYVVLELVNHTQDTIFARHFSLVELNIRAEVRSENGSVLPEWGIVADFVPPVGWKGEPIPPSGRFYETTKIQDRWGEYDIAVNDLYSGHHLSPGRYRFRAHFAWAVSSTNAAPIETQSVTIEVRRRSAKEDSTLIKVQQIAAMVWDSLTRPAFVDSLIEFAEQTVQIDPRDPFLPYLTRNMVSRAKAVGLALDSVMFDRLDSVRIVVADTQRALPAGAMAVWGVVDDSPNQAGPLAAKLGGSLAGRVAADIAARQLAGVNR